jgi:hypothetical protein
MKASSKRKRSNYLSKNDKYEVPYRGTIFVFATKNGDEGRKELRHSE